MAITIRRMKRHQLRSLAKQTREGRVLIRLHIMEAYPKLLYKRIWNRCWWGSNNKLTRLFRQMLREIRTLIAFRTYNIISSFHLSMQTILWIAFASPTAMLITRRAPQGAFTKLNNWVNTMRWANSKQCRATPWSRACICRTCNTVLHSN